MMKSTVWMCASRGNGHANYSNICNLIMLLPCAHAQGRSCRCHCREYKNCHISRCRHLSDSCKRNEFGENWLQCASNRWTRSTGVTNSAFLLANVAAPIDSAYSMHYACSIQSGVYHYFVSRGLQQCYQQYAPFQHNNISVKVTIALTKWC